MNIISEKFNAKINSYRQDFGVNKNITHNGVKGGLNENEISSIIKEVIPQKYKIAKGVIENSTGNQSNETDFFIYDDEILPPYIKNDLAFVPVEAVKYNFEVKSTLNSTEIKTTIDKFENFKSIGGRSPTVLFSFSSDIQGSELSRYKKNDNNFFTNPAITVLCTSNKSYYYKETTEHLVKDYLSVEEFIKQFTEATGMDMKGAVNAFEEFMKNDEALNTMTRSQFALAIKASIQIRDQVNNLEGRKLTVNEIPYDSIKFKCHKWIGIESNDNNVDLSLLSGISNTLSKGNFGSYLLDEEAFNVKIFSIAYEDMWGNVSCQDFNEDGLSYNLNAVSFTYETSAEANKIIFEIKK